MTGIIDARILYRKKREPKEFFDFGERVHMTKHLERLDETGAGGAAGRRLSSNLNMVTGC